MAIASLTADHYRIPLPQVLSDATHGDLTHFELITARVRARDGAEGTGYTYTVGAGGAAIRSLLARDLAPALEGEDEERIEHLWERMWWRLHYVGRGGLAVFALSAVDIALWDLRARRSGTPLWRLLGGHHPRVRAYAGGIDLQFPLDRLLRQTEESLGRGFRAIKMKVGRQRLREDLDRVRALRERLGPDTPLMVDANMRWSTDEAIRASRALAEYDVYWLEEPTLPDDVAGHARILRDGALPVAAGENLRTLAEFARLIDAGGVLPEPA
jgi:L-alanine-DL-glutamate epimerase-like enolase superfamily enzyme